MAHDIPTLLLHGDNDPIIPSSCSRDLQRAAQGFEEGAAADTDFPGKGMKSICRTMRELP